LAKGSAQEERASKEIAVQRHRSKFFLWASRAPIIANLRRSHP